MKMHFLVGYRGYGDLRWTLFRVESKRYVYGDGWKFSISIHPYLYRYRETFRGFRLTVLFINLHWKR